MSDITFLNLELTDPEFLKSVRQERAALKKHIKKLQDSDRPSVSYVNATSENRIHNAIVATKRIIHIAGHGDPFGGIHSGDTELGNSRHKLAKFSDYLVDNNEYLDVDVVILDSCWSSLYSWRRQIARIVGPGREMIIIGSARKLSMDQALEFFDNFYGELLSRPLPKTRRALSKRVYQAFEEAQRVYLTEHHWWSRLRITTLVG